MSSTGQVGHILEVCEHHKRRIIEKRRPGGPGGGWRPRPRLSVREASYLKYASPKRRTSSADDGHELSFVPDQRGWCVCVCVCKCVGGTDGRPGANNDESRVPSAIDMAAQTRQTRSSSCTVQKYHVQYVAVAAVPSVIKYFQDVAGGHTLAGWNFASTEPMGNSLRAEERRDISRRPRRCRSTVLADHLVNVVTVIVVVVVVVALPWI